MAQRRGTKPRNSWDLWLESKPAPKLTWADWGGLMADKTFSASVCRTGKSKEISQNLHILAALNLTDDTPDGGVRRVKGRLREASLPRLKPTNSWEDPSHEAGCHCSPCLKARPYCPSGSNSGVWRWEHCGVRLIFSTQPRKIKLLQRPTQSPKESVEKSKSSQKSNFHIHLEEWDKNPTRATPVLVSPGTQDTEGVQLAN